MAGNLDDVKKYYWIAASIFFETTEELTCEKRRFSL